jgi:hypothetical protein
MSTYKYIHADNTHAPEIGHGFIYGMNGAELWCGKCGQILEVHYSIEPDYIIESKEVIISERWIPRPVILDK